MKRSLFLFLLLMLSQLLVAQSLSADGAVLTAPRVCKKVSGDSVRLRASESAKIDKQVKRVYAKIMQANRRARVKAARELARRYKLGDRVIMRGDSGRDVRSVANILVKKLYIRPEEVVSTFDNGALYDGALYKAVLRFQKDRSLLQDGVIDKELVKELRKRK